MAGSGLRSLTMRRKVQRGRESMPWAGGEEFGSGSQEVVGKEAEVSYSFWVPICLIPKWTY